MTLMLVSVTGPEEAALALAGEADIIDLKDPSQGALGAVDPGIVRDTVAAVAGARPMSAVSGNTGTDPAAVRAAVEMMAQTGVDYVKQGIFPGGDPARCIDALRPLAARTRLIAVLFADCGPDLALLPALAAAGFAGAMLDTADKSAGRLLDHMDLTELHRFVAQCAALGLKSGLAGSLEAPDVPRLLLLRPGLLGFRRALCGEDDRAGRIDSEAINEIRALIPPEDIGGTGGVDHRLLSAHGYVPDLNADPSLADRVFVHDLVLPVRVGAYAYEHAAPQRVRFDVDVLIARNMRQTYDMRDVFSYDVISDGIRLLAESGHVPLVETLAERIAAMLLAHPRVVKVSVRLEKLDTGPRVVGVAIERTRENGVAEAGFGPLA